MATDMRPSCPGPWRRALPLLLGLCLSSLVSELGAAEMGPPERVHGSPPAGLEAGGLPVLFAPTLSLAGQLPAAGPGEQVTADSARTAPARHRRTDKFRQTRWRRMALASASLAVAGTVAARWSKDRADRAYERYLHAADSQRRERAFDRAERYDRLAGVGFLAMEAGLAACAYLVFF